MQKKRVLVLSPLLSLDAPQPIRFRKFIEYWKEQLDVHVLCFNTLKKLNLDIPVSNIHIVEFSRFGKVLINSRLSWHHEKKQAIDHRYSFGKLVRAFFAYIYRSLNINSWFFPDIFVIESKNIRINLIASISAVKPDVVVLSATPFTLMRFAKLIKVKFPTIKVIFDTGDPLYGNSAVGRFSLFTTLLSKYYERKYLKYIDTLVVPTPILKKHYLNNFSDQISSTKITIIEQGVDIDEIACHNHSVLSNDKLLLVYAGSFYKKLREPNELYKAIQLFDNNSIVVKLYGQIRPVFQPPMNDDRFIFGGLITYSEVLNQYRLADILVFIDNEKGVQIPGKVYELIALKKPILYIFQDENSPSYSIFSNYKSSIFSLNNYLDIYNSLNKYLNGGFKFGYDFPINDYSWQTLGIKYIDLLIH